MFDDPRNEEWDFMSGHLDALNAAEGDVPGANASEWVIGKAIEEENNSSDDNESVISNTLFKENWDGMCVW